MNRRIRRFYDIVFDKENYPSEIRKKEAFFAVDLKSGLEYLTEHLEKGSETERWSSASILFNIACDYSGTTDEIEKTLDTRLSQETNESIKGLLERFINGIKRYRAIGRIGQFQ